MRAARDLLLIPRSTGDPGLPPRPATEGGGRIIDFPTMRSALRRRRRLWFGLTLAGLVVGAALHVVLPPKYTAVTDLYLAEPAGEETTAMTNDVNLLKTRLVAERAVQIAHLPVTADTLLTSYQGLAESDAILSVKLSAKTPGDAVAWANAVAQGFLSVRSQQFQTESSATITGLQEQLNVLESSMANLDKQINSLGTNVNAQNDLITQKAQDATQVGTLQTEIAQLVVTANALSKGSHVLDAAVIKPVSRKKVVIKDGLSGLVAGLALGLAIVLIGAVVSDRPRRRIDIAEALGAPVVLSVGHLRGRRVGRRRLQRPGPELAALQARLRQELRSAPGGALIVAAVDSPRIAALVVTLVAAAEAAEGRRIVVIDAADGRPLRSLLRVRGPKGGMQAVSIKGAGLDVAVAPDDLAEMAGIEAPDEYDGMLVLASIDPASGADHVSVWAGEAVVVVTAGEATETRIAATGQMLRRSGVLVRAALVVGADADDDTVGSAPGEVIDAAATPVGVWEAAQP